MKFKLSYLILLTAIAGCQSSRSALDALEIAAPQTLSEADAAAVRAVVALQVNDPSSAVITDLVSSRSSSGLVYVCGLVSGRSSDGTNLGARRFYGSLASSASRSRIFVLIGLGESSPTVGAQRTCEIPQ